MQRHSQLDRKVRLHYITERRCFTHALHLEVDCRRCFPPRARYPWSEFSRSFCPHGTGTHGGTATALNRKHDPQPKPQQATGEPETNPRKETQTQPRNCGPTLAGQQRAVPVLPGEAWPECWSFGFRVKGFRPYRV